MTRYEERTGGATVQTVSDEYRGWVKCVMPHTAALLDIMDSGKTPNFLDIMTALSDLVAFVTECDPIPVGSEEEIFFMSGKFCRFCS